MHLGELSYLNEKVLKTKKKEREKESSNYIN
jgi:hypothetical protein